MRLPQSYRLDSVVPSLSGVAVIQRKNRTEFGLECIIQARRQASFRFSIEQENPMFLSRCILLLLLFHGTLPAADPRPRIIIETDAGGDPDDEQSLVRFLLYTNDLDVVGIIPDRPRARPGENRNSVRDGLGIVRRMIDAYGECHSHLVKHDSRYPTAAELRRRTVAGYDQVDEGVQLVLREVDADDPRPLWFCNWGTDDESGVSCLKRALDRVLKERGPEGYAKFKRKIHLASDDKFGEHTTSIEPPFPLWVDTFRPELDRKRWYHRFSALTAKAGGFDIRRDVLENHGPLGPLYPLNTTHPQKEGDTMTFLYLLPAGLSDPLQPTWGSWGGRHALNENFPGKPYYWASPTDTWNGKTSRDNVLLRWAADLQNDFRARMDWSNRDFHEANHQPKIALDISETSTSTGSGIVRMTAKPGATLDFDASQSTDPDGNRLIYEWFPYPEAGTCRESIQIFAPDAPRTQVLLPDPDDSATAHLILRIRDDGDPPLCSYRRIVVTIGE